MLSAWLLDFFDVIRAGTTLESLVLATQEVTLIVFGIAATMCVASMVMAWVKRGSEVSQRLLASGVLSAVILAIGFGILMALNVYSQWMLNRP